MVRGSTQLSIIHLSTTRERKRYLSTYKFEYNPHKVLKCTNIQKKIFFHRKRSLLSLLICKLPLFQKDHIINDMLECRSFFNKSCDCGSFFVPFKIENQPFDKGPYADCHLFGPKNSIWLKKFIQIEEVERTNKVSYDPLEKPILSAL